jgi:hypothetical protein
MARNMKVSLELSARDDASKQIAKALKDSIKSFNDAEKASARLGNTEKAASAEAAKASRSQTEEFRRNARARETLGVKSEQSLQREMDRSIASYNRLARSGVMSAREQARAYSTMRTQVAAVKQEMQGLQSASRLSGARNAWGRTAAVVGGVVAGAAVVAQPVKTYAGYSQSLARLVNTGFNDKSPQERIKMKDEINTGIQDSVRYGGGTPDQAMAATGVLYGKGGIAPQSVMKVLPAIMKSSTATGADAGDIARTVSTAMNVFKIKVEDIPKFLDKLQRSGELGGMEIADMAKSLPGVLSLAAKQGLGGLADTDLLFANLQANSMTAGDNSQAATNYSNLLSKINSADTINNMKNTRFREANGKTETYSQYMVTQQEKGIRAPDAFMNAMRSLVDNDNEYKKIKADVKKYKGTDKEQNYQNALQLRASAILGQYIPDAQANAALTTTIMQKDYIANQIKGTQNSAGATDASYDVIKNEPAYKAEQLDNEKFFSENAAVKGLTNELGDAAQKAADLAVEFPGLATAAAGAKIAIETMTAAAAAFSGIAFLTQFVKGGKLPGGVGKIPGLSDLPGMSGVGSAGALPVYVTNWQGQGQDKGSDLLDKASSLPGPVGAAASVANVMMALKDDMNKARQETLDAINKARDSGMSYPEYMQQQHPEINKPLFDIDLPGMLRRWLLTPATSDILNPKDVLDAHNPAKTGVPSYLNGQAPSPFGPLNITTQVMLDGQVVAESVNRHNVMDGSRGTGGGS